VKKLKSKHIEDLLNNISDEDFAEAMPENPTDIELVKYQLCKRFVSYLKKHQMSQAELARLIDIDRSRINWIVKYKIQNFTIDRLYELITIIEPNLRLKVS
jgi:predicted XRE-type DNA-binding protein